MPAVLVLDANQRAALAVTRSLGARGIEVYTADSFADALAAHSKHSKGYLQHPEFTQTESCFDTLFDFAQKHDIDTLFPISDLSNQFCIENSRLSEFFKIPLNRPDANEHLSNKAQLAALARTLDIPTPTTWHLKTGEFFSSIAGGLLYPLVIKPAISKVFLNGRLYALPVRYAASEEALKELFEKSPEYGHVDLILQEYIAGSGHGVFLLARDGVSLARFAHQRLRERPPSGGVSVLSESITMNATSLAHAERLLEAVKWTGVAMVEFKLTDDGKPYLIEVNTRFWGSLQLAIDSGVDFPYMLYQLLHGHDIEPLDNYQAGKKLRWLMGDIDYLYLLLSGKSQCLHGTTPIKGIWNFLNFFQPGVKFEVNRLSDFRPFIFELKTYMRSGAGR